MRRYRHGRIAARWFFALGTALALSLPAQAGDKGAMEIGLSSRYIWPGLDVSEFEPAFDYGLVFQYWLNTMSTVVVTFDQMSFQAPFEADGRDEGLTFSTGVLTVGARIRPQLDLFFKPYVEAGLGYQTWSAKPGASFLDPRTGSTIVYFAGAGVEYVFRQTLTAGLNFRYFYMPMKENLESEAVTLGPGRYAVTQTDLQDVGYLTLGVELSWRFR